MTNYRYVIGSIVLDKGKLAQVTAFNCTGDLETTVSKSTNWEIVYNIELTEEILLKSGFYPYNDLNKVKKFRYDSVPIIEILKDRDNTYFSILIGKYATQLYYVSDLQLVLNATPYFADITKRLFSTLRELIK